MASSIPDTFAEPPQENENSAAPTEIPAGIQERTTIDFDNPDRLVGQVLEGRFFIEKNLKESGGDIGGIGVVYLARDTKLMGKDVVVKILNETALQHPDIIRKFEHEKEALVRLDHPGIVRILDSGKLADGNPFMVMDHIKGHSLRKAIQMSGRLPIGTVARIVEEVTDALTAAHKEKILHRDIKPENIMLTPIDEGMYRVRIIDFGIARVEESRLAPVTEISRAIGSVHYIAPEQLIGKLDLTPAADIYSFAIVIYEMLTGELPFKPRTFAEMYQLESEGVKVRPSAILPSMPREAERILMQALEFDREKRPQIAKPFGRLLAHELMIDENDTDRFYASIKTEFYSSPTTAMPVPDLAEIQTVKRAKVSDAASPPRPSVLKWLALAVVLLGAVSVGGYLLVQNLNDVPSAPMPAVTAPETAERSIAYYLMIQKMRDGKPFQEPFRSSGRASVERGYKFGINFVPQSSGNFYIFNFGADEKGINQFNILFPTPQRNGGRSRIEAGQLIETASNTVEGKSGAEWIWMIWTANTNPDLEAAVTAAFQNGGVVPATSAQALQVFLDKPRQASPTAAEDTQNQQTIVTGRGDELVYKFKIEHQ
jgi:serine/threonine protein kinase